MLLTITGLADIMKKTGLTYFAVFALVSFGICQENINLNGFNKFYYENGKLDAEGYYKNDELTGEWKFYLANGKLDEVKNFDF